MTTNDSTAAILSERRWQCAVPRRRIGWVGQPLSLLALALWTSISSRKRGCRRLKTCVEAVERSSRVPKASGELAGLCWMVLVERSGKPRSIPDTRQDDTLPLGYVCVPTCSHRPLELLPSSLFGLFCGTTLDWRGEVYLASRCDGRTWASIAGIALGAVTFNAGYGVLSSLLTQRKRTLNLSY